MNLVFFRAVRTVGELPQIIPAGKLRYRLSLNSAGNRWGAYRFDRQSGAVWIFNAASDRPVWQLTRDKPAIAANLLTTETGSW